MTYTLKWWQRIYYPLYRAYHNYGPRAIYDELKWFIQRGRRGWSYRDWWSMDYYLKDVIPAMLRKYAKDGIGYPGVAPYDSAAKWSKALNKAADDIEAWFKFDENRPIPKSKDKAAWDKYFAESKKAHERTKNGMKFVAENFRDLWD